MALPPLFFLPWPWPWVCLLLFPFFHLLPRVSPFLFLSFFFPFSCFYSGLYLQLDPWVAVMYNDPSRKRKGKIGVIHVCMYGTMRSRERAICEQKKRKKKPGGGGPVMYTYVVRSMWLLPTSDGRYGRYDGNK
ncbi:hypothetical protein F5X96DRAFT_236472 [Biscogniauxia mediterranea]|nr:hypothetical protein F5X96DRAFT_236472 [Biscogniauxia mediterranea]